MNLLHLIVGQWRERPARTLLSVLSVSIAVSAVLGALLAQSSVRNGSRGITQIVEGRPALDIVSATGERIVLADVPGLGDLSSIVNSFPMVSRATLARIHGMRLRSIVVGLPLESANVWGTLPLTAGRACQRGGELLLDAEVAKSYQTHIGDRLTLLTYRGPRSAKVVGLVDKTALDELSPAATMAMPLDAVQELFGLEGQVDRIRILLGSRDERRPIQATLATRLPDGMVVQVPGEQIELADTILRSIDLALSFSGAFSLAMAAFIILNTLRMNFGERRSAVAMLRVLGATNGQIACLHLIEGTFMGLCGSILGIPLGLLLGHSLSQIMQRLLQTEIAAPETPYFAFALAIVLGPIVASLAAILPAVQSHRVTALEALVDAEPRRTERFPVWAVVTGMLGMFTAIVLMLLVVSSQLPVQMAIPVGLLMLVAFIVLIPATLAPIVRTSAWLLSPWFQMEGELAAAQLLRRPVRTGLTAGVLVVAINTGLGMGNAITNNVNDVREWHRRWVSGDVSLSDPSVAGGPATAADRPEIRAQIAAQPNVARVLEVRLLSARVNGVPAGCVVRDFEPNTELPWGVSSGSDAEAIARLRDGEIVVGSVLANKLKLQVGDAVRLEFSGRAFVRRVAALANDYTLGGMVLHLDHDAAARMIELGPAAFYVVQAQSKALLEPLLLSLEKLGRETGLIVHSYSQLQEQFDRLINSIVGALGCLLGVGFIVGGVAVGNTLTMSVLEQTRDLGLLRIAGMTRKQVRKLIFCESLLMGIVGTVMGILAGTVTAWIIHRCTEPLTGHAIPFTFHEGLLVANVGGCLLIATFAGWSPSARAARLDLLSAISYE